MRDDEEVIQKKVTLQRCHQCEQAPRSRKARTMNWTKKGTNMTAVIPMFAQEIWSNSLARQNHTSKEPKREQGKLAVTAAATVAPIGYPGLTTRTCRRFHDFYKNYKNRYFNRKYKSVKIEHKREDIGDQGHYVLQVQDLQKDYQIFIFADDAQRNALPHSQTLVMNGQRVDENYLISKESESSDIHRVYSTNPSISVAFRVKKYLQQQIDYFLAKEIDLDELLSKLFPKFVSKNPVFTWHPAIKYFELNEVTFASTLVFWEWKDVLEFFSPIISFKLVDVTANCNGRSDKMIKRDLLMCLEKHQIPRVHLNCLNFDFETKDDTELKYNLPIEYSEKEIFVIDTDSLLNELERWYLGKRKIEYWKIDVSSERAWKHFKEWINQKGTNVKKTQLGFVVTGAVKNQANQWLYFKAKGGFFIVSKNSFG